MLTLEEQERRAYISGNTELAAALAAAVDAENERDDLQVELDDALTCRDVHPED